MSEILNVFVCTENDDKIGERYSICH